MVHKQLIKTWMAHKRSAVTCVKFSHDSSQVYSCGEDAKVRVHVCVCVFCVCECMCV
jgi:hypothetical protein